MANMMMISDPMTASGRTLHDAPPHPAAVHDEYSRVRMGAAEDSAPELLSALAEDGSVLVRTAVALNRSTPDRANRALTGDCDERVRMVLVRKLTALLPSLSRSEHQSLAQNAWDNLTVLAHDEAERVRGLVADLVKDLPQAPHTLILDLAHDPSFVVSDPVLRLSPVLTDTDLLALLHAPPAAHTVRSIASRPSLDETVCDAIVACADHAAIRQLLSNRSASIREATLDGLVEKAVTQLDWHKPLVCRAGLSARSLHLLGNFVSDHLIAELTARTDLDPAALAPLRARIAQPSHPQGAAPCGRAWGNEPAPAASHAWRSETALIEAIRLGDTKRIVVMIAAAAGVTLEVVERGAKLRSAKAAVSLLWKGGFSMRPAAAIQAMLFNLTPEAILRANAEGGFPLSEAEMRWQIAFLAREA